VLTRRLTHSLPAPASAFVASWHPECGADGTCPGLGDNLLLSTRHRFTKGPSSWSVRVGVRSRDRVEP
jgi:hypothetical protein